MDPPFGKSTIYFRVNKLLKRFFRGLYERIRYMRVPKPTLGSVWLRLSYFEERLHRLDDDSQEMFIENFYHSVRQVNYITMLSVFVIIITYLTAFQFKMIGILEGLAVEGVLVFSLFYIVWYYRMGMEDLMDYLISQETVPDYAFRPRLGPKNLSRPLFGSKDVRPRKARKKKVKAVEFGKKAKRR